MLIRCFKYNQTTLSRRNSKNNNHSVFDNSGEFDTSEAHPDFQRLFRSTWADHANLLSLQYAGSGKRNIIFLFHSCFFTYRVI